MPPSLVGDDMDIGGNNCKVSIDSLISIYRLIQVNLNLSDFLSCNFWYLLYDFKIYRMKPKNIKIAYKNEIFYDKNSIDIWPFNETKSSNQI